MQQIRALAAVVALDGEEPMVLRLSDGEHLAVLPEGAESFAREGDVDALALRDGAVIVAVIAEPNAGHGATATDLMDRKGRRHSSERRSRIKGLAVNGANIHHTHEILGAQLRWRASMLLAEKVTEGVAHIVRMKAQGQSLMSTTILF